MAAYALGTVQPTSTTSGLRATANRANPGERFAVHALQFQALGTNTASVYICAKQTPDLAKDVLAEVGSPSSGLGQWSIGNPTQRDGFNAADFWVVPAISGEGVRVTVIT